MNDLYLDAASRAFTITYAKHLLKWHPELNTPLHRDTAAFDFRLELARIVNVFEPLPEKWQSERGQVMRVFSAALRHARHRFKVHRDLDMMTREIEDALREALNPKLF